MKAFSVNDPGFRDLAKELQEQDAWWKVLDRRSGHTVVELRFDRISMPLHGDLGNEFEAMVMIRGVCRAATSNSIESALRAAYETVLFLPLEDLSL